VIGETIAHYSITSKIGEGGMGEVFRARDTKLNRDVALKLLPEVFAADAERMARFQREAQLLASLNHANIAAIYGVEESVGKRALVLELVEGEDLSEKLSAGTIPVDETLEIAVQIAEALEAAHERGVIHRDLKPANVKITPDGKVKVLDFGLAKALEGAAGAAGDPSQSLSPTLTVASTRLGVILGTAAYMSPEQARGRTVDRRSDIWAFGAVLFEMLARRQMFAGETISDTLAAVIKDDPDWSLLPADTPQPVVDLLGRCLQKDPRRRLQSIGEARIALEDVIRPQAASSVSAVVSSGPMPSSMTGAPAAGATGSLPGTTAAATKRSGPGLAVWAVSLIVIAVLAALAGRMWGPVPPEARTRKFHIDVDGLQVEYPTQPALSPDGAHVAYFLGSNLWIRDLSRLEAVEIPGTNGATAPFWSPDGAWLAYGRGNRIFKVPAAGGTPMGVCDLPFVALDGGSWGEDDVLILAPNSGPMYAVSSRGGDPKPVFPPVAGESDYHTPSNLPGGRGILFTTHRAEGRDTIEVFADGQRKVLLRIEGARLEYAAWAPSGHLVYHRMNTNTGVWAVPFDLDALEVTGEPFILDPDGAFSSVARDGSLLYAFGGGGGMRQLVTVDRSGEITGTIGQPQAGMTWPEVSPDAGAVLVSAQEADNRDIWLHDVERGTQTRMTFGTETDYAAIWMNGGKDIAYTNGSAQSNKTFIKPADGSRDPELILEGYYPSIKDGVEMMAFTKFVSGSGEDIYYQPVDGSAEMSPFLQSESREAGAQLSPDGAYVVYMSNESGGNEVYLTTFPGGKGKWQVSTRGGAWPRWSRAGDEIIYREGSGASASLMSVSVQTAPSLRLGTPVRLFGAAEVSELAFGLGFRGYDVTPDPDTFVMLQMAGDEEKHKARLVYSENWYEAYRKKAE